MAASRRCPPPYRTAGAASGGHRRACRHLNDGESTRRRAKTRSAGAISAAAFRSACPADRQHRSGISAPWFIRPYVRVCIAEATVDGVKAVRTIRNLRGCFFQAPPVKDDFLLVPFNPIGFISPLEASRFAVGANRLLVDFDGTERVLAMKRGLSAAGKAACGAWVVDRTVLHLVPPLPPAPPALPTRHQIIVRPASRASS